MEGKSFKDIAQTLIFDHTMDALEAGVITEADLPVIAKFVLAHTKSIKSHDNLIGFLQLMAIKWPVYKNIAVIEEGKLKSKYETEVAKNMLRLINKGQIAQAVNLAKQHQPQQS